MFGSVNIAWYLYLHVINVYIYCCWNSC